MINYGNFLAVLLSIFAAWGAFLWLMTRVVPPAGLLRAESGRVDEDERAERRRVNAIYEEDWKYHRVP